MRQILPFGKYLLLERISVGGMAEVFKARAASSGAAGKLIAIKRILPSMAEDAEFIRMFIDEARISGQLHHAHIAEIYELGRVADSHFIAMEYVWGKDLLQIQNRFRRLRSVMPVPMAAYVVSRLAAALDYAHKKKGPDGKPLGIIHRDVSPQNVLVSYDGEIKVIDFGIAKAASRSTKTQQGVLKGKFGYMSPEQVSGEPLDHRSDIFALGTILYELLTADRLFLAESDFATLEKVRHVDVPPPREAVASCPPVIDAIVMRALSKERAGRYQFAAEMEEQLQGYLSSLSTPYGARELAAWMRGQFAPEMKREEQALQDQLTGAEDWARTLAAPGGAAAAAGSPSTTPSSGVVAAPANRESGISQQAVPADGQGVAADPAAAEPLELATAATRITSASLSSLVGAHPAAGLTAAAGGAELSVEPTRIFAAAAEASPAAGAGTPAEASANPDVPSAQRSGYPTPTVAVAVAIAAADPASPQPAPPAFSAPIGTPPGRIASARPDELPEPDVGTLPVDAPRRAGSRVAMVLKDVLLGVLVAGVIVGGVLGGAVGGRALLARGRRTATLVVAVTAPRGVRIAVDDQERGRFAAGQALTLRELAAGAHRLHVEAEGGGGNLDQEVVVAAGDVTVVSGLMGVGPVVGAAAATSTGPPAATAIAAAPPAPQAGVPSPTPAAAAAAVTPPTPSADVATPPLAPSAVAHGPAEPAAKPAAVPAPPAAAPPMPAEPAAGTKLRRGHLVLTTDPPGATVTLDGKTAGASPIDVNDIEPARSLRISIRKKGYQTVTRHLDFKSEMERTLDVKLVEVTGAHRQPAEGARAEKADAAPATPVAARSGAEPGFLVANTQPWARVLIDGKDTGKSTPIAPRSKIPLRPGKHVVTFVVDGKKFPFDVEITAGEDLKLIKTLGE